MAQAKKAKKVLIVDDERDLVQPLALRLSCDPRFEVFTAYDGEEGWRQALAVRPEVVLVDLAMPDIDGWQLCRRLRENASTRDAELVIMTAWMPGDLRLRAQTEGIGKVLLKPFEDRELLEALGAEPAAA